MIRFRIVLLLLNLIILTSVASYFFFEPQTNHGQTRILLQVNDDANPYDNVFFEPDSSGLRPGRMEEPDEENRTQSSHPILIPSPLKIRNAESSACSVPEQNDVPFTITTYRSGNMEVRAGPQV